MIKESVEKIKRIKERKFVDRVFFEGWTLGECITHLTDIGSKYGYEATLEPQCDTNGEFHSFNVVYHIEESDEQYFNRCNQIKEREALKLESDRKMYETLKLKFGD
jgi:outer membrane protein assembly factor BamA